jgi:hypothetical protein
VKYFELTLSLLFLLVAIWMFPYKQLPVYPAQCAATDQDRYTYAPHRFLVLSPCLRVTGTVTDGAFSLMDGDGYFDIEVDAPYRFTLNAMNERNMHGNLHVEIVCLVPPEALVPAYTCAHDPQQYPRLLPNLGERVWVEGRWVWDLGHFGHAELHPVYRWGRIQ